MAMATVAAATKAPLKNTSAPSAPLNTHFSQSNASSNTNDAASSNTAASKRHEKTPKSPRNARELKKPQHKASTTCSATADLKDAAAVSSGDANSENKQAASPKTASAGKHSMHKMKDLKSHSGMRGSGAAEREKMSPELTMLKELFCSWAKEDLLAVLLETNNDVEMAIARISEGFAKPFSPVVKGGKKMSHLPVENASETKDKTKFFSDKKKTASNQPTRKSKNSVAPSDKQPSSAPKSTTKPTDSANAVEQKDQVPISCVACESSEPSEASKASVESSPQVQMKPIWSKIVGNSGPPEKSKAPSALSPPATADDGVAKEAAAADKKQQAQASEATALDRCMAVSKSTSEPRTTAEAAAVLPEKMEAAVNASFASVPPPPGGLLPQSHAAEMFAFAAGAEASKKIELPPKPHDSFVQQQQQPATKNIEASTASKCFAPYDVASSSIASNITANLPHRTYINTQVSTEQQPCFLDASSATANSAASSYIQSPFSIGFPTAGFPSASSGAGFLVGNSNTSSQPMESSSSQQQFSLHIPNHLPQMSHSGSGGSVVAGTAGAAVSSAQMSHHPHFGYSFTPGFYNPYLYAAPSGPGSMHSAGSSSGGYAGMYGSHASSVGIASGTQNYKGSFYPGHSSHYHSKAMGSSGGNSGSSPSAGAYGMVGVGAAVGSPNSHLFLDHPMGMGIGQYQNSFPSYYGHHHMIGGSGHVPSSAYSSPMQHHLYTPAASSSPMQHPQTHSSAAALPSPHYSAMASSASPSAGGASAIPAASNQAASRAISSFVPAAASASASLDKPSSSDRPHAHRHAANAHNHPQANSSFHVRNYWGNGPN